MIFNVVSPIVATIDGDSLKDAIKNFIKFNHNMNIREMIIRDQSNNVRANINYYKQDGRNKVGINMFPVGLDYPIPIVTNDTYIPPRLIEQPLNLWPLSPIPLSPYGISSFIPSVINIPTNL
jgi:hypothetical protein